MRLEGQPATLQLLKPHAIAEHGVEGGELPDCASRELGPRFDEHLDVPAPQQHQQQEQQCDSEQQEIKWGVRSSNACAPLPFPAPEKGKSTATAAAVRVDEVVGGEDTSSSQALSSGDKWGAFEHATHSQEPQHHSPSTSTSLTLSVDNVEDDSSTLRKALEYSSLQDQAHIKTTAKISLQEIKKLLRHKWMRVKGDMESSSLSLRASVTRCKTLLEHGSSVAAVCGGSVGDEHIVALVREEMKVIHRGCKDALEESKNVHAEYRHLKVALTETEASVKYMMHHCSNESSFAICAESGTEAELERHELMLAAVLRGKARFGRHRRNVQSHLVHQSQSVHMLDKAMTAVQCRVDLVAINGCAQDPHTEDAGEAQDAAATYTAHPPVRQRASACCKQQLSRGSGSSVSEAVAGADRQLAARRGRGVLNVRPRQCWGVAEEEEEKKEKGDKRTGLANSGTDAYGELGMSGGDQRLSGTACERGAVARVHRSAPSGMKILTTSRRLDHGDGGWYYCEHSMFSKHSACGGVDDDMLQLLEACDDAERLLSAHLPHSPLHTQRNIQRNSERDPQRYDEREIERYGPADSHMVVHVPVNRDWHVHTAPKPQALRGKSRDTCRDSSKHTAHAAKDKDRQNANAWRGVGAVTTSKVVLGDGAGGEGRCSPDHPTWQGGMYSEKVAESRALRSIENHVLSLCKTVSTVEKSQRITANKVCVCFSRSCFLALARGFLSCIFQYADACAYNHKCAYNRKCVECGSDGLPITFTS